ncbi:MAG: aminoacyl-tRNA hydrolase [Candidatus Omnitrophota bacterium]|nr:aminoacyl-tRNA hydrolase [Candidatus Omnitrophota bacterium]
MKLIVGLGNPGGKYSATRHNAGRLLAEFFAHSLSVNFLKKKKLNASLAVGELETESVIVSFPETFMNLSGGAVRAMVGNFNIDPNTDLLVVSDDLALPFGKLRIRPQGSDGGHNGIKSVIETLGCSSFARLRIGIGHPHDIADSTAPDKVEEYVLKPFTQAEREQLPAIFRRAEEACRLWITNPMSQVMSIVNS